MSRPVRFRQVDVKNAIKGVKSAGLDVAKVVIETDGTIIVHVADGEATEEPNPWDEVLS